MRFAFVPALSLVVATLGVAGSALADVAPPPDYVETCTVDQQQGDGETCVSCEVSFEDFEACINTYEPQGYELRCKTAGASVYSEVFCMANQGGAAGAGAEPTNDASESDSDGEASCSLSPRSERGSAVWLLLVGLALAWRRRR